MALNIITSSAQIPCQYQQNSLCYNFVYYGYHLFLSACFSLHINFIFTIIFGQNNGLYSTALLCPTKNVLIL